MVKKSSLVVALILALLAVAARFTPATAATTTTFLAAEDTYVDSSKPTTNFGGILTLWVHGSSPTRRALLRFNLSSIPAGAQISSATLKLYVSSDGSSIAGNINALTGSWAEKTVTYATAPAVGALIRSFPNPASPLSSVSANVTSYVAGKTTVSFYITTSSNDGVVYYSHEKGSSLAPRLSVTWSLASTATPTLGSGSSPTPTRTPTPLPTSTSTRAPSPTPTSTPLPTSTSAASATPTRTSTPLPTSTSASSPTATRTSTPLPTSTSTSAATPPATATPTSIPADTATPTSVPADTATPTATATSTSNPVLSPTPAGDPVVMAAGDIICDSLTTTSTTCQQMAVSQVILDQQPSAVFPLGDLCHTPSVDCFDNYYDPSWGRFFDLSNPVPGNHDYLVPGAIDYFDYWNGVGNLTGRAGDRTQGYYSFDLGTWHIIALNSNCGDIGGCNSGSPQYTWLQQDLQAHPAFCTLAYWHIPVFSSGGRAEPNMQQVFTLLYNKNADIVLNGHDHIYERYYPIGPNGLWDTRRGVRQFIVGTGGANHTSIVSIAPGSEVRNAVTFGALKLSLRAGAYDWRFLPAAGGTFTDSGTSTCH